jgi:hypothetical protein
MSASVILLLIYNETRSHLEPVLTKDTHIATDPMDGQYVDINMDIVFPNAPCYLIQVTSKNSVNTMSHEQIFKNLNYIRLDSEGKKLADQSIDFFEKLDHEDRSQTVINSIDSGEQCEIVGSINLRKVVG